MPRQPEIEATVHMASADALAAEAQAWLVNRPVAIAAREMDGLLSVLARREGKPDPTAFFSLWGYPEEREKPYDLLDGGIAQLRVRGTFRKESRWGPSYAKLRGAVEEALGDPAARAILLDVDSPGGTVDGLFDLVDWLVAQRGRKPIWSIANDWAASAAYGIASAADRVWVTRTGGVGSVGVIAVHVEFSAMDERVGITFTPVIAGERKKDLNDFEPIDPEAKRLLQVEVDRLHGLFVRTVARNRADLTPGAVRKTEAGVFYADAATEIGFADEVGSFEELLDDFRASLNGSGRRRKRAATAPPEEQEDRDMADPQDEGTETTTETTTQQPEPGAQVVDLESARAEGSRAERESQQERARQITTLCQLAGHPELAGQYIGEGLSPEAVGQKLLEQRAAGGGPEIRSVHQPGGGSEPVIDAEAIYARRAREARGEG